MQNVIKCIVQNGRQMYTSKCQYRWIGWNNTYTCFTSCSLEAIRNELAKSN